MSAPPQSQYQPISFADVPGWADDDHAAALAAFRRSALREPDQFPASLLEALRQTTGALPVGHARAFFEQHFEPLSTTSQTPAGFVTGYYEPELSGRLERSNDFTVPLYRRPPDLVNLIADAARGAGDGTFTHVRQTTTGTEPYATRAEIETGALAGQGLELAWLADPVDAFFLHVQGSGILRLDNGQSLRVAYDGKNGHPYTSIGRSLIDEGAIAAADMSLEKLGAWLRADPIRARAIMQRNRSFVFFKALDPAQHSGPVGVDGIPLTAGRSLAVDPRHHAIGTPIYVVAEGLMHTGSATGWRRLMIAQDVGSAITGPERGDIFYGTGSRAGTHAGFTKHSARFITLRPIDRGPQP